MQQQAGPELKAPYAGKFGSSPSRSATRFCLSCRLDKISLGRSATVEGRDEGNRQAIFVTKRRRNEYWRDVATAVTMTTMTTVSAPASSAGASPSAGRCSLDEYYDHVLGMCVTCGDLCSTGHAKGRNCSTAPLCCDTVCPGYEARTQHHQTLSTESPRNHTTTLQGVDGAADVKSSVALVASCVVTAVLVAVLVVLLGRFLARRRRSARKTECLLSSENGSQENVADAELEASTCVDRQSSRENNDVVRWDSTSSTPSTDDVINTGPDDDVPCILSLEQDEQGAQDQEDGSIWDLCCWLDNEDWARGYMGGDDDVARLVVSVDHATDLADARRRIKDAGFGRLIKDKLVVLETVRPLVGVYETSADPDDDPAASTGDRTVVVLRPGHRIGFGTLEAVHAGSLVVGPHKDAVLELTVGHVFLRDLAHAAVSRINVVDIRSSTDVGEPVLGVKELEVPVRGSSAGTTRLHADVGLWKAKAAACRTENAVRLRSAVDVGGSGIQLESFGMELVRPASGLAWIDVDVVVGGDGSSASGVLDALPFTWKDSGIFHAIRIADAPTKRSCVTAVGHSGSPVVWRPPAVPSADYAAAAGSVKVVGMVTGTMTWTNQNTGIVEKSATIACRLSDVLDAICKDDGYRKRLGLDAGDTLMFGKAKSSTVADVAAAAAFSMESGYASVGGK